MVPESELDQARLLAEVTELMGDEAGLEAMRAAMLGAAKPQAAAAIYGALGEL